MDEKNENQIVATYSSNIPVPGLSVEQLEQVLYDIIVHLRDRKEDLLKDFLSEHPTEASASAIYHKTKQLDSIIWFLNNHQLYPEFARELSRKESMEQLRRTHEKSKKEQ